MRLGTYGRARQISPRTSQCALFAYTHLLTREAESMADFCQRTGMRFPKPKAQAEDVGFRLWEAGECPIQMCSALCAQHMHLGYCLFGSGDTIDERTRVFFSGDRIRETC